MGIQSRFKKNKNYLLTCLNLICAFFIIFVFCFQTAHAESKPPVEDTDTFGDDLIPWPWGSECAFPWNDIEGRYRVSRTQAGPFMGHYLDFVISQTPRQGVAYLEIQQFNSVGRLISSGQGYSLADKRIVRGLLTPARGGDKYSVIVRSYAQNKKAKCNNQPTTLVVSFCPLHGRRCQEEASYELFKQDGHNIKK